MKIFIYGIIECREIIFELKLQKGFDDLRYNDNMMINSVKCKFSTELLSFCECATCTCIETC